MLQQSLQSKLGFPLPNHMDNFRPMPDNGLEKLEHASESQTAAMDSAQDEPNEDDEKFHEMVSV